MSLKYFVDEASCIDDDDDDDDEDDEDDEDELLSEKDGFLCDSDDEEDDCGVGLSGYAACDQMRDKKQEEITRNSFQKGLEELEERYRMVKQKDRGRTLLQKVTLKIGSDGVNGMCVDVKKRRLVGGKRRRKRRTGKVAPIFSRGVGTILAVGTASDRTLASKKRAAYVTCANGFCTERVKPGSLWCVKHTRKKQRLHKNTTQQEVTALKKGRKKLAALLPVFEKKRILMSFAFTAPGPNTCVRCGLPKLRGVMVCENHKLLRELNSAVGVHTKAGVEASLAVLDKKLRVLQHMLNKPTRKQALPHIRQDTLVSHRCLHCQHRWSMPAGTIVDECPKCGDCNLN